jgi:hypothetical protein
MITHPRNMISLGGPKSKWGFAGLGVVAPSDMVHSILNWGTNRY